MVSCSMWISYLILSLQSCEEQLSDDQWECGEFSLQLLILSLILSNSSVLLSLLWLISEHSHANHNSINALH